MRHILVVEDDPQVCELFQAGLELAGYRVTRAASIREADAALVSELPDAALIDLLLPDGSGLDLARGVADRGKPVLLTTASFELRHLLEIVGCPHVPKPVRIQSLTAELGTLLGAASAHAAHLSEGLRRMSEACRDLALAGEHSRHLVEDAERLLRRSRSQGR